MATFDLTCHGCGGPFTAKSSRAKWCRPGCKKRKQRHPDPPADHDELEPETGLVASLRKELEDAGVLDTFGGQLALSLARKVSAVDATGVSGLSKELRNARAEALAGGTSAAEPAEPSDPDDELRNKRDAKRQAAREAAR